MIVRAGGLDVAYDDVGSGVPVLLLHGFPHDRTLWAPQTSALAGRARLVAPDLRGFGETRATPPYSVDQYADDAAALLAALGVDRAVVAGLSMGGYVAFAFWRRHRRRVRALVLADTRAGADSEEARARRRELSALARQKGSVAVADAQITGMVGKTTREQRPEVVEAMHRMLAAAPVRGIVGALEAMMARPDSTLTLQTIDVPTLVVVGDEDVLTPEKEARAMHEAIEGSRLEVIAGAGHVSNVEQPDAFNRVLGEFLSGLAEGRG
jgi:pimeloyl-ACP methyl ester carboxylesterase